MEDGLTFEQWYHIAYEYALTLNYCLGESIDYVDYFEDGYTPESAVREDLSNLQ